MLDKRILKELVILDSAVVDECQSAIFAEMGMRIIVGWLTMCSPSSMRYADLSVERLILTEILEIGDFTHRLINIYHAVAVFKSDAGTVISAIFKSVKAFDQDVIDIPLTDISYYSAH